MDGEVAAVRRDQRREFDDVFMHLNSFGRYQMIVFLSLHLLIFPVATQFDVLLFAFSTPGFHCVSANNTCAPNKCCDGCTSYAFDGPFHSTVSEWNLVCDRAHLGATIQSCYFLGMLFGSFITGMISDAWGRKKCIFVSNALMLVAGVASSFVDCISFLAFLRFLVGFGLCGVMLPLYIYGMEFVGPTRRTLAGNITFFAFSFFGLGTTFLAYYIRNWRYLLLACTLPAALLYPFWRAMPRSPRWLIAHNYLDEAHAILMKYGGKNNQPVDADMLRSLLEDVRRDQLATAEEEKMYTPLDLVRTRRMRKWTILVCYQWFVVALVSFGILLFVSQLAGSPYLNFLLINTFASVKVLLTWIVFLKFGRRIGYVLFILVVACALLIILAVHEDFPPAVTALSLMGYITVDCNWTGIYIITSEIYPTVLRNTAQGIGSMTARIGAVLAPYISMMSQLPGLGIAFPVTIFGVLALIGGILMYWIPETLFAQMHQTIGEAEAAKEDFDIPCWGKKRFIGQRSEIVISHDEEGGRGEVIISHDVERGLEEHELTKL